MGDLPILKLKNWLIFIGDLPFLNFKNNFNKRSCFPEISLFSWRTAYFEIQQLANFHGQPTIFNPKKKFSKPPCFPKIGLFLWATCPFWNLTIDLFWWATYHFQILKIILASVHASLKLVNFQERPVLFEIQKLIFFHRWLTYPFLNSKNNRKKRPKTDHFHG
jgi:hypothetical protein